MFYRNALTKRDSLSRFSLRRRFVAFRYNRGAISDRLMGPIWRPAYFSNDLMARDAFDGVVSLRGRVARVVRPRYISIFSSM